jgi:hypothetical protein
MKQFALCVFVGCMALTLQSQSLTLQPNDILERLYHKINVAGQAALMMPTAHD